MLNVVIVVDIDYLVNRYVFYYQNIANYNLQKNLNKKSKNCRDGQFMFQEILLFFAKSFPGA